MASHGHIGEYSPKTDSWSDNIERLEQTGKRRAILLSSCGSDTYSLIKKLVAPKLPTEKKTFDEISKTVGDYYEPSNIVECFRFKPRVRHINESVAAYVTSLRGIAQNYEFSNIDE